MFIFHLGLGLGREFMDGGGSQAKAGWMWGGLRWWVLNVMEGLLKDFSFPFP